MGLSFIEWSLKAGTSSFLLLTTANQGTIVILPRTNITLVTTGWGSHAAWWSDGILLSKYIREFFHNFYSASLNRVNWHTTLFFFAFDKELISFCKNEDLEIELWHKNTDNDFNIVNCNGISISKEYIKWSVYF